MNSTDFAANWLKWSTWQRNETVNFWGHGVKGQGHVMLKLDREAWQWHCSQSLTSSWFSNFHTKYYKWQPPLNQLRTKTIAATGCEICFLVAI